MYTSQVHVHAHCDRNKQFIPPLLTLFLFSSSSSMIKFKFQLGTSPLRIKTPHPHLLQRERGPKAWPWPVECKGQWCLHVLRSIHPLLSPFCWDIDVHAPDRASSKVIGRLGNAIRARLRIK